MSFGVKQLVEGVVATVDGVTKKDAETIIRATFNSMADFLVKGESVSIPSIFTILPVQRDARIGRNPQKPEEEIQIPAHKTLKIKVGTGLKEKLNANK